MHPKHFFDQQQNKRWPEINLKIFFINKGFTCITYFFHKNPVSLTAWEEDWNRLIFGCIVNPQIFNLDYLFMSVIFSLKPPPAVYTSIALSISLFISVFSPNCLRLILVFNLIIKCIRLSQLRSFMFIWLQYKTTLDDVNTTKCVYLFLALLLLPHKRISCWE